MATCRVGAVTSPSCAVVTSGRGEDGEENVLLLRTPLRMAESKELVLRFLDLKSSPGAWLLLLLLLFLLPEVAGVVGGCAAARLVQMRLKQHRQTEMLMTSSRDL